MYEMGNFYAELHESTREILNRLPKSEGLKKLNKSDPSTEVSVAKNGDIILSTCGVHLERCITDLENIFALVPVKRSEPIINFRETITWANPAEGNNEKLFE